MLKHWGWLIPEGAPFAEASSEKKMERNCTNFHPELFPLFPLFPLRPHFPLFPLFPLRPHSLSLPEQTEQTDTTPVIDVARLRGGEMETEAAEDPEMNSTPAISQSRETVIEEKRMERDSSQTMIIDCLVNINKSVVRFCRAVSLTRSGNWKILLVFWSATHLGLSPGESVFLAARETAFEKKYTC